MKQNLNREDRRFRLTGDLTAILTALMLVAGVLGIILRGVRLLGAVDRSADEVLHFLYLVCMVTGVAAVLVKIVLLPADPKEFRARACRGTFRTSGNIFVFLALLELVNASVDGEDAGLFQIFNLEVTLQLIIFVFNAFLMYSIARFLEVYAAYEEDSRLTI